MFTVSVNPSYFCNFRCDFCYLTPDQLGDKKVIEIDTLDSKISEIFLCTDSVRTESVHFDLYGGEIGVLKHDYLKSVISTIKKYSKKNINLITNLSALNPIFFEDGIDLSVSFDFDAREKSDTVFNNMLMVPKPISVLILASKELISKDVKHMLTMLDMCKNIISVEIKPYSANQSNCHSVSHRDFELFVIKFADEYYSKGRHFSFVNAEKIDAARAGKYNAFSDNHIYITPNGRFAVLEFDLNDREYFLEMDSFSEYIEWTKKEKTNLSPICKACPYVGKCLTEHYRYVKDLKNGCNGYRYLLENF